MSEVRPIGKIHGEITVPTAAGVIAYDGPYEVTPTTSEQILATSNRLATQDIIVHSLPQNIGLIGWDGSVLTVS